MDGESERKRREEVDDALKLRLKKTLNINRVWEDIMLGVLGGVDNVDEYM